MSEKYSDYISETVKFQKVLYSPSKKRGFLPENGSEVFVRQIPPNETEYDLLQFFKQVGDVFQIRLMMAESGERNRGFGYVTYFGGAVAKKAVDVLKNVPYKGKHYLVIECSLNNCRLFIGGIPTYKRKDQVWQELYCKGVKNIVDVIMYRSYSDRAENRGFVFIEFKTHEEAAHFRAKFAGCLKLWDYPVVVDWSVPVPKIDEEVMNTVKIIYLRNLDVCLTREDVQSVVLSFTAKSNIEKVYKFKNYSFIHVATRELAEYLMEKLKGYYSNTDVEVTWANPPNRFTTQDYRHSKVSALSSKAPSPVWKSTGKFCSNCCRHRSNQFQNTRTLNEAVLSPNTSSSLFFPSIETVARSLSPYEAFCMELSENLDDIHSTPKITFDERPRNNLINYSGRVSRQISFNNTQDILSREFQMVCNDIPYETQRNDLIPYRSPPNYFVPTLSPGQPTPAFFSNGLPISYQTSSFSSSRLFENSQNALESFTDASQSNELSVETSLSVSPSDLDILPRDITFDVVQDLIQDIFD